MDPSHLKDVLSRGRRLVVFLHDNPDPDTIASGWLLSRIGEQAGLKSLMVYGGTLGRAENRTMVKLLRIPLHNLEKPRRFLKSDVMAIVDAQPGTGNNSFPASRRANIIIDHHPSHGVVDGDFVEVDSDEGCCTTMVLRHFRALVGDPDPDLATAAAYALLSETQDMKREATRADKAAFQSILADIRQPILGRIRHPVRTRDYYRTVARAMQKVELGRHTCVCHVGHIPYPEVIAELADLLVAMERISWCLVTGYRQHRLIVSLRAARPQAQAERVIRKMMEDLGRGGGHGMMAGGAVECADEARYCDIAQVLTERFLAQISSKKQDKLNPLISLPGKPSDKVRNER